MESRGTSALVRRAEQLKRWEASETNQEASKNRGKPAKIKFTNGCVFLAACAAGDTDEVKQLLQKGTDIDTANVDGLTALHQACIDDKLDMVEFLVEHGSDVNRGDNEGWTALHATASCGFISIAKYLIDAGANVAAVNYDGDIPIDISQSDEMDELLQKEIDKQGIDCDKARNEEELLMLEDASAWLKNKVIPGNIHDKTGASPLHVAAAKGYVKVMSMLIDAGTNVDIQDYDGWSPIHAAAHWCQRESCELLVENFCDMDIKNFAGQTAFDVADSDILPSLEDLKKKQATLKKDKPTIVPSVKKFEPPPLKRRTSVTRMSVADKSNVVVKDASAERALLMHPENLDEVQSQVRIQDTIEEIEIGNEDENDELVGKINEVNNEQNNILNDLIQQSEKQEKLEHERKKKNEITDKILDVQKNEDNKQSDSSLQKSSQPKDDGSNTIQQLDSNADDVSMPSFRRLRIRNAMPESDKETSKDTSSQSSSVNNRVLTATVTPSQSSTSASPSTANSESFTIVSCATSTSSPIKAWTLPTITNTSLLRSSTYPNICSIRTRLNERNDGLQQPSSLSTTDVDKMSTSPTLITTSLPCNTNNVRRSMVPPVRDDESETQRRAHAKRVRETRRSTQGVTLEDLKSAEQQYLRKQQEEDEKKEREADQKNEAEAEKRVSWRQRFQQLQDEDPSMQQTYNSRPTSNTQHIDDSNDISSPVTSVTLPLRRTINRTDEQTSKDKDADVDKNTQGTQAVIIRRRRPKRRSTGVVYLDLDDDGNSNNLNENEKKSDDDKTLETKDKSRLDGSSQSLTSTDDDRSATPLSVEYNEDNLDYKRLYEEVKAENELLKLKLRKTEAALKETREQLDKALMSHRNSMSDAEKRERRALERKLSEMEEELKKVNNLKVSNDKLREENGALERVANKLSQ